MKGFFTEFKKFAMRGSVIDLAVGVIIGGAFGKITASLVDDLLMPLLGLLTGKIDFSEMYLNLSGEQYSNLAEAREAGAVVISYGQFLNVVLQFLLLAFAIFMLVRAINKLQEKPEAGAGEPVARNCPFCVSTIDVAATRCPHCTSEVPPLEAEAAA